MIFSLIYFQHSFFNKLDRKGCKVFKLRKSAFFGKLWTDLNSLSQQKILLKIYKEKETIFFDRWCCLTFLLLTFQAHQICSNTQENYKARTRLFWIGWSCQNQVLWCHPKCTLNHIIDLQWSESIEDMVRDTQILHFSKYAFSGSGLSSGGGLATADQKALFFRSKCK